MRWKRSVPRPAMRSVVATSSPVRREMCIRDRAYTMLDIVYDDIMFFKECGVRGLFFEAETHGIGMQHTMAELIYKMNWYPDMTEEEFDAVFNEVLEDDYGDGWAYIREYIDGVWRKSQDVAGECWNCWGSVSYTHLEESSTPVAFFISI